MSTKIPKTLRLPFGYTIRIYELPHDQFVDRCGSSLAMWVEDGPSGGSVFLDRTRSVALRRADLVHELQHAVVDWKRFVYKGNLAEVKG